MIKNVYKSDKYILRQKYKLTISVPYKILQSCLLPPMTPLYPNSPPQC